jgi:Ca2+-binding EF-hand superfamily protein
MFERFDRNADGVVTPDEIPEQMKLILTGAGVKLPERITREQFRTLYAEMRKRFQRPAPKKN